MNQHEMIRCLPFAAVAAMLVLGTSAMGQAVIKPYTPDTNTLHLWHLDETSGSMVDSGLGTAITMSKVGNPVQGASAYTKFGSSLGINNISGNAACNTADGLLQSNWQGADGAFTYEALICVSDLGTPTQFIINRDWNELGRAFQFYITSSGQLGIAKIVGGIGESYDATIPTDVADPDHFVTNEWFHVAVTYNGNAGAANNVTLYWTRVQDSAVQANVIGFGTLTADISPTISNNTDFGNRGDGSGYSLPLHGSIDEVRVSSIARLPRDFIFQVRSGTVIMIK